LTSAFRSLIRRPCFTFATLASSWVCLGFTPSRADPAARDGTPAVLEATASDSNNFHLGTAASPFGWASAVADFDDDGVPDFTVADRVADSGGPGYNYRIQFSVAGRVTQSVSFESPFAALTVAVQDVDHDHHLDVLVREAPSAVVDAVWLNDGHGRFVESPIRPPSSPWLADVALGDQPSTLSLPLIVSHRIAAPPVRRSAAQRLQSSHAVTSRNDRAAAPSLTAATPCRAPPPRTRSTSFV
jgi:hypothetical protein